METIPSGQQVIIRSKHANATDVDDLPLINLQFIGPPGGQYTYNVVWNDLGSDADYDVSIYRPSQLPENYYLIGDYAQNNYVTATGYLAIASVQNDDPNNPVFQAPTAFAMMWSTNGTTTDTAGSIWAPLAPQGYIAIGWVAQNGLSAPSIPQYMCVRQDFVEEFYGKPNFIWDDRGSNADSDIALYSPGLVTGGYTLNTFIGQGNYDSFNGSLFIFTPA